MRISFREGHKTVLNPLPKLTLGECASKAGIQLNQFGKKQKDTQVFRIEYGFQNDGENVPQNLSLDPGDFLELPVALAQFMTRDRGLMEQGLVVFDANKDDETAVRLEGLERALEFWRAAGSVPLAKKSASFNDKEQEIYKHGMLAPHHLNV